MLRNKPRKNERTDRQAGFARLGGFRPGRAKARTAIYGVGT